MIIWSKINLGTMDEEALFVTDFDFNLIDIDFTQIEQVEAKIQEHSVLASRVDDAPVEIEEDDEPVQTKATFDW
jgi:replicative DNA helicase